MPVTKASRSLTPARRVVHAIGAVASRMETPLLHQANKMFNAYNNLRSSFQVARRDRVTGEEDTITSERKRIPPGLSPTDKLVYVPRRQ